MAKRVIEISERVTRVSVKNGLLTLQPKDGTGQTIPLEEVAVLLFCRKEISLTGAAVSEFLKRGTLAVFCDERSLPVGVLLPLVGHGRQARFFQEQTALSPVRKKHFWRQVVQAKIQSQSAWLRSHFQDDFGLGKLSDKVRSDDTSNIEGLAARIYWEKSGIISQRDRKADDANRLLNYGYTILYASMARAICSAGLHPTMGIHHHNQYNSFCLASDLMEPFRTVVDEAVWQWTSTHTTTDLTRETKQFLAGRILNSRFSKTDAPPLNLFHALRETVLSMRNNLSGLSETMVFPLYDIGETFS